MSARIICHAAAPLISILTLTLGKNSSVDLKRWKWTHGCLEGMDILYWHGTLSDLSEAYRLPHIACLKTSQEHVKPGWSFLGPVWSCCETVLASLRTVWSQGKPESILPWTSFLVSETFQKLLGNWSFLNKNTHVRIVVMFGCPRKWRWCSDKVCVQIEHLLGALLDVCYKAMWT